MDMDDPDYLNLWRRQCLEGSFRSYMTRGSEPLSNIQGKIKWGRRRGLSDAEIRRILEKAQSDAYNPDRSRYEEIADLLG